MAHKDRHNLIDQLKACCKALDDKKATDLTVLDVARQSSITNYFIVATGTSEPHLKALRNALEKALDDMGVDVVGVDYQPESGWLVLDAFDFIVHIFLPRQRESYRIESLWKDAAAVDIKPWLTTP